MNDQNFTTTITVDRTPEDAFAAINSVRGWWSEEIEGSTDKLGDEWTYRYKVVHICKMKITELIPGKKVVWLVLDNYFNFTQDKTEWKGTEITFEVSKKGDTTEIRFTHLGLVPEYECFDICSNAWGSYVNGSLRSLIATGKGKPNQKEKGSWEISRSMIKRLAESGRGRDRDIWTQCDGRSESPDSAFHPRFSVGGEAAKTSDTK